MTPSQKISDGQGTPLWIADRPAGGFIIRQARSTVRASDDEAREIAYYILAVLDD
ncbi:MULTISPECIES: hypothetical protein [Gordonia]|uniref:Uncharacterized protein n=1 Tax=Gordonia amicalis TaxID=89053 RepID=A0ABU4D9R9_9ACTN|nr:MULTISPECIES: hypothetical protein [Gordonia]MDV6306034.1 hypothetical protein [Gordonia amicalis]